MLLNQREGGRFFICTTILNTEKQKDTLINWQLKFLQLMMQEKLY